LKSELLVTQWQSESKMAKSMKDPALQISCLAEMINLDPFDSTSFSELGLFHYSQSDWVQASQAFHQSINFGPPAIAMNFYFLGKCYLHLNDFANAENSFLKSYEADDLAVSPLVSLIELYIAVHNNEEAVRWARIVNENQELNEQLDSRETDLLRGVLN